MDPSWGTMEEQVGREGLLEGTQKPRRAPWAQVSTRRARSGGSGDRGIGVGAGKGGREPGPGGLSQVWGLAKALGGPECSVLLFCRVSGEGSLPAILGHRTSSSARGHQPLYSPRQPQPEGAPVLVLPHGRGCSTRHAEVADSPTLDVPLSRSVRVPWVHLGSGGGGPGLRAGAQPVPSPRSPVPYRGIGAAKQAEHQQEDPAARIGTVAEHRAQGRGLSGPRRVPRRPRHRLPRTGCRLKAAVCGPGRPEVGPGRAGRALRVTPRPKGRGVTAPPGRKGTSGEVRPCPVGQDGSVCHKKPGQSSLQSKPSLGLCVVPAVDTPTLLGAGG